MKRNGLQPQPMRGSMRNLNRNWPLLLLTAAALQGCCTTHSPPPPQMAPAKRLQISPELLTPAEYPAAKARLQALLNGPQPTH